MGQIPGVTLPKGLTAPCATNLHAYPTEWKRRSLTCLTTVSPKFKGKGVPQRLPKAQTSGNLFRLICSTASQDLMQKSETAEAWSLEPRVQQTKNQQKNEIHIATSDSSAKHRAKAQWKASETAEATTREFRVQQAQNGKITKLVGGGHHHPSIHPVASHAYG